MCTFRHNLWWYFSIKSPMPEHFTPTTGRWGESAQTTLWWHLWDCVSYPAVNTWVSDSGKTCIWSMLKDAGSGRHRRLSNEHIVNVNPWWGIRWNLILPARKRLGVDSSGLNLHCGFPAHITQLLPSWWIVTWATAIASAHFLELLAFVTAQLLMSFGKNNHA